MRGHFPDHLSSNNGRHAFLRLYSGTQSDQWALDELISTLPLLLQFHAGISFIVSVHERLRYRYSGWTDALFQHFDRILTCPPGSRLFSTIVATAPAPLVAPFARFVVDRFFADQDPELTNLAAITVRVFPDLTGEYRPLLALGVYLGRPAAAAVAVALLECCDPSDLQGFVGEAFANVTGLLMAPELIVILNACLSVAPRAGRTYAIAQLAPRFEELAAHPWAWRVPWTVLSVGTMRERVSLLQVVVKLVNAMLIVPHMDELLVHALDSVDAKSRLKALEQMQAAVLQNPAFPLVNAYFAALELLLDANAED
jgi:hypothetical protein